MVEKHSLCWVCFHILKSYLPHRDKLDGEEDDESPPSVFVALQVFDDLDNLLTMVCLNQQESFPPRPDHRGQTLPPVQGDGGLPQHVGQLLLSKTPFFRKPEDNCRHPTNLC